MLAHAQASLACLSIEGVAPTPGLGGHARPTPSGGYAPSSAAAYWR